MSNSATLEFKTSLKVEEISQAISEVWTGHGYAVSVYSYPQIPDKTFCTLDYFFGYAKEREMLVGVLRYLDELSPDQEIYYYRCSDFAPITKPYIPVLAISVNDLFTPDFSPSLGASIETKYLLTLNSVDVA